MNRFFTESKLQVPQDFIQRFISNYLNQQTLISSQRLFEWFHSVRPNYKYEDFLKRLRKICKPAELKEPQEGISGGRVKPGTKGYKKLYLVS